MKLLINFFIVFNLSFAFAQDEVSTSTETVKVTSQSAWTLGVALESTSFGYIEPGVMTVDGRLNGVVSQARYKGESNFWFLGNVGYLTGSAKYVGKLMSGAPYESVDKYTLIDLNTKGLILTDLSTSFDTSIYLGLGQTITDDANDPDPSDYYRRHIYQYYSWGILMDVEHSPVTASTWIIGFDTMMSGTTESRRSDVHSSLADFTLKFNGGNAMNLEWQYKAQTDIGTIFGGFAYKKWSLNQSEIAVVKENGVTEYYAEPKNTTETISLKLGAQF